MFLSVKELHFTTIYTRILRLSYTKTPLCYCSTATTIQHVNELPFVKWIHEKKKIIRKFYPFLRHRATSASSAVERQHVLEIRSPLAKGIGRRPAKCKVITRGWILKKRISMAILYRCYNAELGYLSLLKSIMGD